MKNILLFSLFVIIYGFIALFSTVLFQLTFIFIYSIFSNKFQFQQNKRYPNKPLKFKQGTRRKKPSKECGGTSFTQMLHLQAYSASPTNDAIIKRKYTLWFHESINTAPLQSILKKMNHPWYP